MRRGFGAVVCCIAGGMAIAFPFPASGHYSSTEYSYPSSCSGAIDPVSLVFYGPNATGQRSQTLLHQTVNQTTDDD